MARVAINTGASANDGTGDNLRYAGGVVNNNFLELYTYLGEGSTTVLSAPIWSSTNVGISTLRNVGIGTTNATSTLTVSGNGRFTGVVTATTFIGALTGNATTATLSTNSQGLTGTPNIIVGVVTASRLNVGTGITLNGSTGIISATAIVLGGTTLTGSAVTSITAGSGISVNQSTGNVTITATGTGSTSQFVTTAAGIHTLSNVGIGTTNPTSKLTVSGDVKVTGVVTATSFVGNGSGLTGIVGSGSGIVVKDSGSTVGTAGTIDFGDNLTVSAISAGIVTVTGSASGGSSQFVTTAAGIHTLSNVGIGTTNPTSALTVVGASGTTLLVTGGTIPIQIGGNEVSGTIFKVGQINLSGPNASDVNSTYYSNILYQKVGDFRYNLEFHSGGYTGYGGAAPAGGPGDFIFYKRDISYGRAERFRISGETGDITSQGGVIAASTNVSGIATASRLNVGTGGTVITTTTVGLVGIGTTNPQGTLQVGTGITMYGSTGIISATTFVGNFSGSITNATNLTGGYANASQLNVSGVATISQGRIQADGSSNLRFGNIAAGSGSGRNIAIGDQVLYSLSSGQGRNIGIGELSYYDTTSGQYNIGLGIQAGQKITTGNYNVILGGYDGQTGLDIRTSSNNVVIADGQGNIRQYINSSGNVGIKTTVITAALTVAGIVSATSFYGTLNAGQLTGSLPAINGSALIGVVGSGSGVIIQGNGTPVGTAGTINFASNLNVTFASGIATVSGTGLATYANVAGIATYATSSGVSTTSGTANYATSSGVSTTSVTAGYATTAGISSAVSASININTTGIITASSFSGSGSGLTNLPAAQLTGTLPAIDGSALLNVTAAGTGIAIRDDNSNIGSATTINFGTGLDVTFSAGIATITASGGSLQSRTTVSGVTTSIANNGIGNTNITGFKSYGLMKVGLSTAGWLRLYTDSTSRTNDISRSVGTDPAPGSGVIAEVVTTGITTTQIISPFVMGGNLDNSPTTTIYAAITNLSGITQAITANLTILKLEA